MGMMMQELELEEGEACYKDDASIDPDVALSYIGDKVQSLLGHHQKDFEGGFSAENLGAKYGGYGSFLPMYQRSPCTWLQPKSPKRVQTPHLPRSLNHISPEGHAPNSVMVSDASSTRRNDSPSPSISASQAKRSSFEDDLVGQKAASSSDKVAAAFPGKDKLPVSNSGNPPDQKTLKVRIKLGADRVAQYNAEIYSLGLTSPSSLEGDSHDESDELMLESHEITNGSPANILQIMASPLVSGGLLLSPLAEALLNLPRETEYLIESASEAAPNNATISATLSHNDVLVGKQKEVIEKSKKFKKLKDKLALDLNDGKLKTFSSEDLEHNLNPFDQFRGKPIFNAVRQSEKDAQVKNRKGNKDKMKEISDSVDLMKDTALKNTSDQICGKSELPALKYSAIEKVGKHGAKVPKKDVSVDLGQCRTPGNRKRASSIAQSDNSEGEGVKGNKDCSSLKVGLDSASNKCNGFGMPHGPNRLSIDGKNKPEGNQTSGKLTIKADSLMDGESKCNGKKDSCKLQLSQKDVVQTRFDHLDNPRKSMERPSSGARPKDAFLGAAKVKPASADKMKPRSSGEKYLDKVTMSMHTVDPPVAAVDTTVMEPVLIEEDWVECDRCKRWRLLAYGMQANQLPEKWICSMQCWLPGMNCCEISEDETTKAIQALNQVLFLKNQHNFQTHADGAMAGVISAGVNNFNQNPQYHVNDHLKKQKLKEKQKTANMGYPGPCKGKKHLHRMAMKDEFPREVEQSLDGVNMTDKSDMQQPPNRSTRAVSKSNKRKSEHVIEDDANPRKKIKQKSAQLAEVKENKSMQVPMGNAVPNGLGLAPDFPNQIAKKDGLKKNMQKEGNSVGAGNFTIYGKKEKDQMQDFPDNASIGSKACNGMEVSTKRIKLRDYVDDNQHQGEAWQNNGSYLQDRKVSTKKDSNDSCLHKSKKSRVSKIEADFKINRGDNISKRESAEHRIHSSGSKECSIEKEEKVNEKRKLLLTVEDIDKLKKDLGCEHLSTTATSSSSKVSDSHKNRSGYMGVRGSPQESVSSSPVRTSYPNEVAHTGMDKVGKAGSRINKASTAGSLKKVKGMDENYLAPKHEVSSNKRHSFSEGSDFKSLKHDTSVGKRDLGKSSDCRKNNQSAKREHDMDDNKLIPSCRAGVIQKNLTQDFPRSSTDLISRKLRINSNQGDDEGALCPKKHGSRALTPWKSSLDASLVGETSKAVKDPATACLQNGTGNCTNNEAERSMVLDSSLGNKNTCNATALITLKKAEDVWKEAEELRSHADLIKNSGFSSESNYEYFKAALKFLHGASLFESCAGEGIKHLEMSPMQMYGAAAKLFRTCASEYGKGHEMASACLAYKCVEVAYFKVVYCKSSTMHRVWNDLQSNLHMVPQGESPSSSASDVDNLNNLATVDKVALAKVSGSQTGNHTVLPRNRPNFVRLLDYAEDVISAIEAAKKLEEQFSAALIELEESQNTEAIVALKRVVELSFQNVEDHVRLALLTFNTINHNRG